jgi:hypothetical protein
MTPAVPNGRPDGGSGGAAQHIAARPLVQIEPLLLNRADAARLLSVSPRKLDQWVKAGLIRKWKLDGVVRFAVEELRAFVASQQAKRTAGDGHRPRAMIHPGRNGIDAPPV